MSGPVEPGEYRWDGPGPAALVASVRAACREADGHDPLDEAAELHLKHRGLDGASLHVADDAGFALVVAGELSLAVRPHARRGGVGTTLAAAAAGSAERAWSHGDHPGARALAARHGFRRTRELWVMRRSLDALEAPGPADPSIAVRGFRPGDEEQLLAVNAAAFADHPEQGAMDERDLAERMAEPWFDPAGLLMAYDGDELLGFHWTKRHDADHGEVYVVGISPGAQGRGLGRLLTAAGLRHLAEGGAREVLLYVEADNAPARRLYEGLGFAHAAADTHVQYTR